jgi:hypothetical protein
MVYRDPSPALIALTRHLSLPCSLPLRVGDCRRRHWTGSLAVKVSIYFNFNVGIDIEIGQYALSLTRD